MLSFRLPGEVLCLNTLFKPPGKPMKKLVLSTLLAGLILNISTASTAQDAVEPAPLQGRVEAIEGGANLTLPTDILRSGLQTTCSEGPRPGLPSSLKGRWYGTIHITQMDTFPQLHVGEPYCTDFIQAIEKYFHRDQRGQIVFEITANDNNYVSLASSDVWFGHGLRVQLTSSKGPALVEGGTNLPRTLRDDVSLLDQNRVEQSRYDFVTIVDDSGQMIHSGFSEVTALYVIAAPRRLKIKILSVDYDRTGKPLWKSLMTGEATR